MTTPTFNPDLPFKTRDGREVRDLHRLSIPLDGFHFMGVLSENTALWRLSGAWYGPQNDPRDLVNDPQEPKWRPFMQSEIKPGMVFRRRGCTDWFIATRVYSEGIWNVTERHSFAGLLSEFMVGMDGLNWYKAGVKL